MLIGYSTKKIRRTTVVKTPEKLDRQPTSFPSWSEVGRRIEEYGRSIRLTSDLGEKEVDPGGADKKPDWGGTGAVSDLGGVEGRRILIVLRRRRSREGKDLGGGVRKRETGKTVKREISFIPANFLVYQVAHI